jgi:hypothetical protein
MSSRVKTTTTNQQVLETSNLVSTETHTTTGIGIEDIAGMTVRIGTMLPRQSLSRVNRLGMEEVCEYQIAGGMKHLVELGMLVDMARVMVRRDEDGMRLHVLSGSRRSSRISKMAKLWL